MGASDQYFHLQQRLSIQDKHPRPSAPAHLRIQKLTCDDLNLRASKRTSRACANDLVTMWSNGFGNPGPFQNNFNPDSFSQMPFGAPQGQQFFAQQGMMPFGSPTDENVMDGEYQPDRAMNFPNQAAFMQNQNVGAQVSLRTATSISEYNWNLEFQFDHR